MPDSEIEEFRRQVAFQEHKLLWYVAGGMFFAGLVISDLSPLLAALLIGIAGLLVVGSGARAIFAKRSALRLGGAPGTYLIPPPSERPATRSRSERLHAYWSGAAAIAMGLAMVALGISMVVG